MPNSIVPKVAIIGSKSFGLPSIIVVLIESSSAGRRYRANVEALSLHMAICRQIIPISILVLGWNMLDAPCSLPFEWSGWAHGSPLPYADGDIVDEDIPKPTLTIRGTMPLWADVLEGD